MATTDNQIDFLSTFVNRRPRRILPDRGTSGEIVFTATIPRDQQDFGETVRSVWSARPARSAATAHLNPHRAESLSVHPAGGRAPRPGRAPQDRRAARTPNRAGPAPPAGRPGPLQLDVALTAWSHRPSSEADAREGSATLATLRSGPVPPCQSRHRAVTSSRNWSSHASRASLVRVLHEFPGVQVCGRGRLRGQIDSYRVPVDHPVGDEKEAIARSELEDPNGVAGSPMLTCYGPIGGP